MALKHSLGPAAIKKQCDVMTKAIATYSRSGGAASSSVDATGARGSSPLIGTPPMTFNRQQYTADCLQGLEEMELKERTRHMIRCLHKHLLPLCGGSPPSAEGAARNLPSREAFHMAAAILSHTPQHFDTARDGGHPFAAWPFVDYVAEYGAQYPDISLALLKTLTPMFSAEFAIRPFVINNFEETFAHAYTDRCHSDNEHHRRLASEGFRPRLPWGLQVGAFVRDPAPMIPILDKLRRDDSLYVRKSVANSLNDISRDNPAAAIGIVRRWIAMDSVADEDSDSCLYDALRDGGAKGATTAAVPTEGEAAVGHKRGRGEVPRRREDEEGGHKREENGGAHVHCVDESAGEGSMIPTLSTAPAGDSLAASAPPAAQRPLSLATVKVHPHTAWIIRHGMRTLIKKGCKEALALVGYGGVKGGGGAMLGDDERSGAEVAGSAVRLTRNGIQLAVVGSKEVGGTTKGAVGKRDKGDNTTNAPKKGPPAEGGHAEGGPLLDVALGESVTFKFDLEVVPPPQQHGATHKLMIDYAVMYPRRQNKKRSRSSVGEEEEENVVAAAAEKKTQEEARGRGTPTTASSPSNYYRKVFKLTTLTLDDSDTKKTGKAPSSPLPASAPATIATLQRTISFRPITTRKYYNGAHRVEVVVNGTVIGGQWFNLVGAGDDEKGKK